MNGRTSLAVGAGCGGRWSVSAEPHPGDQRLTLPTQASILGSPHTQMSEGTTRQRPWVPRTWLLTPSLPAGRPVPKPCSVPCPSVLTVQTSTKAPRRPAPPPTPRDT